MWRSRKRGGGRTYRQLSGAVHYNGVHYKYEGRERDWYIPHLDKEEIWAMGRLFEIKTVRLGLVGAGRTLAGAEKSLLRLLELYFSRIVTRDRDVNWEMYDN